MTSISKSTGSKYSQSNAHYTFNLIFKTFLAKPTTNNEVCHIPFEFNGIESFFCVKNDTDGDFECETKQGQSVCNLGN